MKWHRIKGVLRHSWYHFTHSRETWIDMIWITTIEFIVFGFLSRTFAQSGNTFGTTLLLGLLFWETVRIGQYCVTISILWDIWSRSMNSLFVSPLKMSEWIVGQVIATLLKTFCVISILCLASRYVFGLNVLQLGPMLIIYFGLLFLFAVTAGIFITGLLLRFGTVIQSLGWGMIFLFQPISGLFYPVEALPIQIRWVSYVSPITFVMQAARYQWVTAQVDWSKLVVGVVLTFAYLLASCVFLQKMYGWSKRTGSFARLEF